MNSSKLELAHEDQLGIANLDQAHQELINLFNRIVEAAEGTSPIYSIRESVRTFLLYARWHFAEEEDTMLASQFPGFLDHQADHHRLLQDAEDFVENFSTVLNKEDALAVAKYFRYWIVRHTENQDAKFKSYLQDVRIEQLANR